MYKACGLGKQVKPTPGRLRRPVPVCVVELESAWICDEEEKRAGFKVNSTGDWPPQRIAGFEGLLLLAACR